jgi:hypothetical protein
MRRKLRGTVAFCQRYGRPASRRPAWRRPAFNKNRHRPPERVPRIDAIVGSLDEGRSEEREEGARA